MTNEIGWTKEDSERRRKRFRDDLDRVLYDTCSATAKRRENLLRDILSWDEARNYIMPYRLRDPIRKELGE